VEEPEVRAGKSTPKAEDTDPRELLEGTTPGPWSFRVWAIDGRTVILTENGLTTIARCERENARLIAAAPDLARRLAEREERLKQEERFKFAANKRAEKLATLLREFMEAHEWYTSLAEPGSPLDKLTKRASAALAKGEG
jgi:hypothetical protein